MSQEKILIIGTGIIGSQQVKQFVEAGHDVVAIALEKNPTLKQYENDFKYILSDRNIKESFEKTISNIRKDCDVNIVIDTYSYDAVTSLRVLRALPNIQNYITMSTTLVSDPRQNPSKIGRAINEDCPYWDNIYNCGSYVWNKINLEKALRNYALENPYTIITILRLFHVLGQGCYLGCLSPNNREPKLFDKLKSGTIQLAHGGRSLITTVDVVDIARITQKFMHNDSSGIINVVNPSIYSAIDYYKVVANELGILGFNVEALPINEASRIGRWTLMSGPDHIFSSKYLNIEDFSVDPESSIRKAVQYIIANPKMQDIPISKIPVHKQMNKGKKPHITIQESEIVAYNERHGVVTKYHHDGIYIL